MVQEDVMKLRGKVAIVTGSSRGIGRATALLFGLEGANVVVNYHMSHRDADAVVTRIGKDKAIAVGADVSRESDVTRLVQETLERWGRIDILVNNAGEIFRPGDWKSDMKTWRKTIDVNLTSAWLMIREIAPIMLKQKRGSIVNLTSSVGIRGVAPVLPYSCAKGGIISLTKAFAKELAPGIRVNAVAPSNVMTDMTKGAGAELIERFRQQTPLKRIAEPEELARAILFLASDESSYVTGHTLVVDGGFGLN